MTDSEEARLLAERYIDFQPRTSAEVRRRLTRAGYEEAVVEQVVADLECAGLLDDARFSAEWVESRGQRKGLGQRRLTAELRQKGVSKEQTDDAVGQLTPELQAAGALEAARRRLGQEDLADAAVRRRLVGFLQRRGYTWDTIEEVFTKLLANTE